jgi:hypothetical protein
MRHGERRGKRETNKFLSHDHLGGNLEGTGVVVDGALRQVLNKRPSLLIAGVMDAPSLADEVSILLQMAEED